MTLVGDQPGELILLRVPEYGRVVAPSAAGYGWIMPDQDVDSDRDEVDDYLDQVVENCHRPELVIQTLKAAGDVASTIVDTAVGEQVDLIVMTTHGYSGFTRWMLGSVTERVLRSTPCPVLVIRFDQPLKHILITLDGSRLAEHILYPALEMARRLSAQVTVLRVDHEEKLTALDIGLLEIADSELCKEISQHPEKRLSYYLDCVSKNYPTQDLDFKTTVVKGHPAQSILEYAEAHGVDLIAMATHGYTGLRRWVYGSVTGKILHEANCAMLVDRPPEDMLQ
jgi:nucleotide-binding universal stress UspA family protein